MAHEDEEARRHREALGKPPVPALVVDGMPTTILHISQIASLLGLSSHCDAVAERMAWDTVTIPRSWMETLSRLGWEIVLQPTPSRGRKIRNLTVNTFHPFELIPAGFATGQFEWYPERVTTSARWTRQARLSCGTTPMPCWAAERCFCSSTATSWATDQRTARRARPHRAAGGLAMACRAASPPGDRPPPTRGGVSGRSFWSRCCRRSGFPHTCTDSTGIAERSASLDVGQSAHPPTTEEIRVESSEPNAARPARGTG